MPEFKEGPIKKALTFLVFAQFQGRSHQKSTDLPCFCPISRKVLPKKHRPSLYLPNFKEGPIKKALTFLVSARIQGRSDSISSQLLYLEPCGAPLGAVTEGWHEGNGSQRQRADEQLRRGSHSGIAGRSRQ